jgi:hypothetical protein
MPEVSHGPHQIQLVCRTGVVGARRSVRRDASSDAWRSAGASPNHCQGERES